MRRLLLLAVLLLTPAPLLAQGRTFDGTNDNLIAPDNSASGLDTAQRSWSFWLTAPAPAVGSDAIFAAVTAAGGTEIHGIDVEPPASAGLRLMFYQTFSTATGVWASTDVSASTRHHVLVTYDRGATTNDPVIYVDGTSLTLNEDSTPSGTTTTGDDTFKMGEYTGGSGDFTGTVQYLAVYSGLFDAAARNRARWWGRPHGGAIIYHPFVTSKLADEGSAAETLTANGSVMAAFVTPVVRTGTWMLGEGVGW